MTDPVADLLTRIRNASRARHETVDVPSSKLKLEIVRILKEEGYIANFSLAEDDKQGMIRIQLR
jgi:small subunit ribosomal protein S8